MQRGHSLDFSIVLRTLTPQSETFQKKWSWVNSLEQNVAGLLGI